MIVSQCVYLQSKVWCEQWMMRCGVGNVGWLQQLYILCCPSTIKKSPRLVTTDGPWWRGARPTYRGSQWLISKAKTTDSTTIYWHVCLMGTVVVSIYSRDCVSEVVRWVVVSTMMSNDDASMLIDRCNLQGRRIPKQAAPQSRTFGCVVRGCRGRWPGRTPWLRECYTKRLAQRDT